MASAAGDVSTEAPQHSTGALSGKLPRVEGEGVHIDDADGSLSGLSDAERQGSHIKRQTSADR
jgi:hypothetical protein